MVHRDQRIDTPAASDEMCRWGDELQYKLNEGPCLQSIHQHEAVRSADLTAETRWRNWSHTMSTQWGVRSMLCVQLFITHDTLGALNLYSMTKNAFNSDDQAVALALAAHIAVALSSAEQFETLQSSAAAQAVINQAKGMLSTATT